MKLESVSSDHRAIDVANTLATEMFCRFDDHTLSASDAGLVVVAMVAQFVTIVVPPEERGELVGGIAEAVLRTLRSNGQLPGIC